MAQIIESPFFFILYLKMLMTKKQALQRSFFLSFLYVGFASITILSIFPENLLYGNWVIYAMILTLPANVISFGILYGDADQIFLVAIAQIAEFFIWMWIFYKWFFKHKVIKGEVFLDR